MSGIFQVGDCILRVSRQSREIGPSVQRKLSEEFEKWGGTKFAPGCFTGDENMHEFLIGVISDFEAWQAYGQRVCFSGRARSA